MKTYARCIIFFLISFAWLLPGSVLAKPAGDIKAWPLFYRACDPATRDVRTEILWPLYVRQTTPAYTANQFLSLPQQYPGQYPDQFYWLWPLSGVRTGHGHDAWMFPFFRSGADPKGENRHLALFPAFYHEIYKNDNTLNIALLQHNQWDRDHSMHALFPLL